MRGEESGARGKRERRERRRRDTYFWPLLSSLSSVYFTFEKMFFCNSSIASASTPVNSVIFLSPDYCCYYSPSFPHPLPPFLPSSLPPSLPRCLFLIPFFRSPSNKTRHSICFSRSLDVILTFSRSISTVSITLCNIFFIKASSFIAKHYILCSPSLPFSLPLSHHLSPIPSSLSPSL